MDTLLDWDELCDDPQLRDLPYKIEINARGNIEMSPTRPFHGIYQGKIFALLASLLPQGHTVVECAIIVSQGVRVPDVIWIRKDRFIFNPGKSALVVGPDICVEVLSPSNTDEELLERRRLYSEIGCIEFWTCGEMGEIKFFIASSGENLEKSAICPEFPARIESGFELHDL